LLNENDVVNAVCSYLEGAGYKILQRCSTTNQGIDIIAKHRQRLADYWSKLREEQALGREALDLERGSTPHRSLTELRNASTQPHGCIPTVPMVTVSQWRSQTRRCSETI